MKEDKEETEEFKVVDRRRFTSDGESLKSEEENIAEGTSPSDTGKVTGEEKADSPLPDSSSTALPEPDFVSFMASMAASALMHLGDTPNPMTGKMEKDPVLARHTIDTIEMLSEKTSGNLSDNESRFLKNILSDLKIKYVTALKN